MIEDKKLGLKIAENPLETLWTTVKDNTAARIKTAEESLIIERAVLKMAEDKLKECQTK